MDSEDMNYNNNNIEDDNNENNNNNNFEDEEFDSTNTSENQDEGGWGNDSEQDHHHRPNKKKRYHRHTQHQIHEMEGFFKECPHPDDKQRKELSRLIGLDHLQIKFWFQNKRTQNKNQQERHENTKLRTENERLKADRRMYQEAITKALCPKCGSPTAVGELSFEEHHIRLENARLTQEIAELSAIAERCITNPVMKYPLTSPPLPSPPPPPPPQEFGTGNTGIDMSGNGGNISGSLMNNGLAIADRPKIIELAVRAMEELMMMAQLGEPLWMGGGVNGTSLALNLDEYMRTIQRSLCPTTPYGFRVEASRETAVVAMNHMSIISILMDQKQWLAMFGGLVARAMTLDVLSTGVARNYNGAFHLITAEFQVLSPRVSTRECYFVRYCQQQEEGLWAVVDVSIDHFIPNLELKCRKRPSGCLIQEIPNGFSKVTWVEHVEVDDRGGVHNMYKQLVSSGQALGASRWLATLDRQCERLASIMATNPSFTDSDDQIRTTSHGKKSILKLAERMVRIFFTGVTSSTERMWNILSGGTGDGIRVMTSKSLVDPGRPPGTVLCAATSFWVPVPPKTVFDFLRDENNRVKWDVLSTRGVVQKIAQFANGRDCRNCVSLLRSDMMMMVQESSTDPTASYLIYAPVDVAAMESVLGGGDSDNMAILPSGFAILPDGTALPGGEGGGGSLVTVAFQILVDSTRSGRLTVSSVATVESLVRTTAERIKAMYPCYST